MIHVLVHVLVHAHFTEDVLTTTLGITCPIKAGIVFEVRVSLILGCHKTQGLANFKAGLSFGATDEVHFGFSSLFVNKGGHGCRSRLVLIDRFGSNYALRAA